jgi:hypothetical protein
MKILFLVLAILFLQATVKSQVAKPQRLPEWFRVYTYDDSIIELNTNYVMFSNRNIERVRFRWSFQTPQILSGKSDVKYQSVLQEIQFDCQNKTFRLYVVQWFDFDGKVVASENKKESEELQEIKFGSIMEKLYPQACKLIALRKREPAVEQ